MTQQHLLYRALLFAIAVLIMNGLSACTLTREYAGDKTRAGSDPAIQRAERQRMQEEMRSQQARMQQERDHERMREHMAMEAREKQQSQWRERLQGAVVGMHEKLRFRTGSSELNDEARDELRKLAGLLVQSSSQKLRLKGYTDSRGGVDVNQALAQARVEAVRSELITQGARPEQVEIIAPGEVSPVATNQTAAGRAKNRRVEVEVLTPPSG